MAGISTDWYVRLEQGRAVRPSEETVEALARALRLCEVEHAHLHALARGTAPAHSVARAAIVREVVPEPIRRLVEGLAQPAYVTGRRWDVLAWNAAVVSTFTDFADIPVEDRNVLVYMLTDPAARRLFGETWADEARRLVAQFHRAYDLWAGDAAFTALLMRLQKESPEFGQWWDAHDVRDVRAGQKRLLHPERGVLQVEYTSFQSTDDPRLKLVVFTVA